MVCCHEVNLDKKWYQNNVLGERERINILIMKGKKKFLQDLNVSTTRKIGLLKNGKVNGFQLSNFYKLKNILICN